MNKVTAVNPSKASANVYAGLGDVLGAGFGDLMKEGDEFAEVSLDDILRKPTQVRGQDSFEDEDNTLDDLAASIRKHGVLQAILVRPIEGGPKPYELVAGERRYIGSQRAGKNSIPTIIRKMTDEEAEDIQLAENIHRKNLTQIEVAKRIQRDLDNLGSVDAVLEKHSKSRAWLSKILSLLTLPEQTKRLVSEKITADVEVINAVKTVEKHDPKAAKALVDDLKQTRGKADARDKANAVKEAVKPPKKQAKGIVATPPDLSHKEPGSVTVGTLPGIEVEDGKSSNGRVKQDDGARAPALAPAQALNLAYSQIFEKGNKPKTVLEWMQEEERANCEKWLETFYAAGKREKNISLAVIQGFRKGMFATDGDGAFALLAFLQGADDSVSKFNLLDLFGLVKE